ncbi:proton-coupled folate transporter-like isoform X1 [Leptidea sinapis]|uniref:proton-coupled folate transporter-like isoform X1 n=2 Tax=Leptidea sinapis TaxID=189913 RepID=UPI002130BA27|nr:proton-coupled folate transporter-like isoform X1 [Leptidea sinapis]
MAEGTDLHELEKLSPSNSNINGDDKTKSEESSEKWRLLLEPALVGAMMAINLGQTSLQNFYLRTACTVDLGHSPDICNKGVGEEFRAAEVASQVVVSSVNVSRSFIGSLMSTVVLLFVGPWSDCSGRRKPLLVMPLIGMSVMTTAVLLMLTFPGASTVQVLYAVQIPISLGGNFGLLLAASFSHIGDVCHASGRDVTRTMGTHRAAVQIAHVIGSISGPLLYRTLGFYGVFPLVLLLQLSSLIYVLVAMKDVNVNTENKVSVVNWRLPFNAVHCLLRPREGYKRMIIVLMLIVALGDRVLLSAEVLVSYMYYRYKFNWDDILFGSFLAYRNIVSFVGTLLILTVLKRRLRLSDETVGVVSCMSYVLATSGLIAARSTLVVFMIPVIGIISQGSQVVQRPIINKQILPNEQGKIYSVLGALESATQTISSPLYSLLYSTTVPVMPDAWLIPGITLAVIQIIAYFFGRKLRLLKKNTNDISEPKEEDNVRHTNEENIKDDNVHSKGNMT